MASESATCDFDFMYPMPITDSENTQNLGQIKKMRCRSTPPPPRGMANHWPRPCGPSLVCIAKWLTQHSTELVHRRLPHPGPLRCQSTTSGEARVGKTFVPAVGFELRNSNVEEFSIGPRRKQCHHKLENAPYHWSQKVP